MGMQAYKGVIPPVPHASRARVPEHHRTIIFVVGGEEFQMSKPFVGLHSPLWKRRFEEEPTLDRAELDGDANSFRAFASFMQGVEGHEGEVNEGNVLNLLYWAKELDVGYVPALCEEFLLLRPPSHLQPMQLLDLASRHNMPLLYTRALETLANAMTAAEIPDGDDLSKDDHACATTAIREDVLRAHISMGVMRNDAEGRRRQRFGEYGELDEAKQRARLLWKSRPRFVPPPADAPEHDWRKLQTCWPHHSLRGDDWVVVPAETQPTMPLRSRGVAAKSASLNSALKIRSGSSRYRRKQVDSSNA